MIKIYRSLKTNIQTQGFEDNYNPYYKSVGMRCHGGYDWGAKDGETVCFDCSCSGYVLNTEIDSAGGLGVNIITETDGLILKHRYWHFKSFNVVAGQKVDSGDIIGWADNTGMSTGTHLHRDVKEMIKDANGNLSIKDRNNGTFGTIDYAPYFVNEFVVDVVDNLKKQVGLLTKLIELVKMLLGLKK